MFKITIPNNNTNERKYILDVIFSEFLGLEYELKTGSNNYEIGLENGKILSIKDTFFNKYPADLSYLKLENIPDKITDLDIFSSCFFMLTRWEEYVNKNRDFHNRFPATESLAFKQDFLDKPIVNELVERLKIMLLDTDNSLVFKKNKPHIYLTHDVDELYMWKGWRHVSRVAMGDILKRKSISLAISRFIEYKNINQGRMKDPFDTFDWLMKKSESIGVKSHFYFMSGGVTEYDNRYDINELKCLSLIEKIKQRGHIIGLHPSYNAYNNKDQFKLEKDLLQKIVGQEIAEGREHFLRFEVPTTWQMWSDAGMKIDSTCGYASHFGFRCGTGNMFSVFNILTRKKLFLKERPLVVMDSTLLGYQKLSIEAAKAVVDGIKLQNTSFTILWHNSQITQIELYSHLVGESD